MKRPGFTLVELLVAVAVSSILITITAQTYAVFRRGLAEDQARSNAAQNGRVAMERIARDARQAEAVVTDLPTDPADTSPPQPGAIEFQDGHADDLTYKRYFVSGGQLKMETAQYYFPQSPGVRTTWNASTVYNGNPVSPVRGVITLQDIADGVQSLAAYLLNGRMTFVVTTLDGSGRPLLFRTAVQGRNL